jgi:hypothetical protein
MTKKLEATLPLLHRQKNRGALKRKNRGCLQEADRPSSKNSVVLGKVLHDAHHLSLGMSNVMERLHIGHLHGCNTELCCQTLNMHSPAMYKNIM